MSDRIRIPSSGTVLQGAGAGRSTLHFTRGLNKVDPNMTKRGNNTPTTRWSWSGGLIRVGDPGFGSRHKQKLSGKSRRGEKTIQTDKLRGIKPGQRIFIEAYDDSKRTLSDYLYRGAPGDDSKMSSRTYLRQVVKVLAIEKGRLSIDRPLRFDLRPE